MRLGPPVNGAAPGSLFRHVVRQLIHALATGLRCRREMLCQHLPHLTDRRDDGFCETTFL